MVYYIGISTSLADVTGISPLLWSALLFLVAVYFLRRESLSATVASALVIGIINILIIIILSVLAFPHVQSANLQYTNLPFVDGRAFDPRILELIFGVVLAAYFGHSSAGNAAKVVLRRDPGGASLIWGNVAAMATAIVLYSLWVVAVNGAIPSLELSSLTGTALTPLAARVGGIVPILGILYVILAMGMGSVHVSYGLFYQVREALPASAKRTTQFLAGLAPVFLLFLAVEWMLFTHRESFSGLLGILGILLLPIMGGIFPMLMMAASRRKGEYTARPSFGFLGSPLVLGGVYLIYVGSVFAYGLFIWEDPLQRLAAIGVGLLLLAVTVLIIRQGAFTPRAVLELRVEQDAGEDCAALRMLDAGKPVTGTFQLTYAGEERSLAGSEVEIPAFNRLTRVCIDLPSLSSRELKVWLHRITPGGNTVPLPAAVRVGSGEAARTLQPDPGSSHVILALGPGANTLEILLHAN
jgi:hypothetical protein